MPIFGTHNVENLGSVFFHFWRIIFFQISSNFTHIFLMGMKMRLLFVVHINVTRTKNLLKRNKKNKIQKSETPRLFHSYYFLRASFISKISYSCDSLWIGFFAKHTVRNETFTLKFHIKKNRNVNKVNV